MKNKLNLKNDLWINLLLLNKKQQKNLDEHITNKQKFHKIELEDNFFFWWIKDNEIIQPKYNNENKYYLVNIYILIKKCPT